jgi:Xaa-Pro aminopeptidase
MSIDELYPSSRLVKAREAMTAAGLDTLLVTPGSDLRYLTGYDAIALERLTCLVLPADGEPTLVVPRLERPAAEASPASDIGLRIVDYVDGTSPYPLVRAAAGSGGGGTVGLANRMWAEHVLALRDSMPGSVQRLASEIVATLRIRKTPAEIDALRRAGAAIDAVHVQVAEWLLPGRTERQVAEDIAQAIRTVGHASVDFTIVASGPNGASPHHGSSDRVIEKGDAVVVDIGGTMPDGYCSDCSRTYLLGGAPSVEFATMYESLRRSQEAAVAAVRPGISAQDLDAVARDLLTHDGYGEQFLHRTGHGIGLDSHEEPYIVTGNPTLLQPGMAFSIEPGVYVHRRHGARIEDIVVCTESGVERLNQLSTELVLL